MAQPITWRTVVGPSLADAARPMEYARQGINQGFDIFGKALNDYNDRQDTAQRLSIQELLQGAKTPEELAALNPQVQSMMAGLGNASREKLLGAEDKRLKDIRSGIVANQEHTDWQNAIDIRDVKQQVFALQAQGRTEEANALAETIRSRDATYGDTVTRGVDRLRGDQRFANEQQLHQIKLNEEMRAAENQGFKRALQPLQLAAADIQNEQAWANLQKTITELGSGGRMTPAQQLTFLDKAREIRDSMAASDDTVKNSSVAEAIRKEVSSMFPDKKEAQLVMSQVNKVMSDPNNANIGKGDMLRLIAATNTNKGWFGLGSGKNLADEVAAFRGSPDYLRSDAERTLKRERATSELQAFNNAMAGMVGGGNSGSTYTPYNPSYRQNMGGSGAGTRNGNGYDTVYGYGQFGQPEKPISQSTIGEAIDFGQSLIRNTKGTLPNQPSNLGTSAVGKYQFTQATLKEYGQKIFGDNFRNTPMTPENQDRLAEALFNDRKNGNLNATWEGLPDTRPGAYKDVPWSQMKEIISKYEGTQGNRTNDTKQAVPRLASDPSTATPVTRVASVQDPEKEPVPSSAPAQASSPAPKAETKLDNLFQKQVALEQDEITAGVRKDFSPEVQKYLDKNDKARQDATKKKVKGFLSDVDHWITSGVAGAVDVATAIPRAAVMGINNAAELGNAFFPAIPYDKNPQAVFNEAFPAFNKVQQARSGVNSKESLDARRKALEEELAKAKGKK